MRNVFGEGLRLGGWIARTSSVGRTRLKKQNAIARGHEKIHHRRVEKIWQQPSVIRQTEIIARSFRHWTGRDLLAGEISADDFAEKIFRAPFVLVAHGPETDPVLNYGNQAALGLWEMTWEDFIRTPSRLTAEAPNREERARLLAAVTRRGFIDDYSGVRISQAGRRFCIAQATVWNLILPDGKNCGQAARFSHWEFL